MTNRLPKPLSWLLFMGLIAVTLTTACSIFSGGAASAPPTPTIEISQQAAQSLEDKMRDAAATASQSGQIQVTVTDQEVTSYLQLRLDQSAQQQIPVTNPQIRFVDGQIQLSGKLKNSPIAVTPVVYLTASAQNGRVATRVTKVDFGPVPVPAGLLDTINTQVQQALNDQLQQVPGNLQVTGVTITTGQMMVTGTVQ